MSRLLLLLLCWMPLYVVACGVHQDTGLYLVTEPGSLSVFERIVVERQNGTFNNQKKPDHFKLYSFTGSLSKNHAEKIPFSLFEAVKGHYSEILLSEQITIQGRQTLPSSNELILISELDVLDALATGQLNWSDAKKLGLARINGLPKDIAILDRWFTHLFSSDRVN